jgi:hypothetical protein
MGTTDAHGYTQINWRISVFVITRVAMRLIKLYF